MPTMPSRTMEAYKAYTEAKTDEERIRRLEEYLSVIPKHKGTDHERGMLRRKLAQMREKLEKKSKGGKGVELNVRKEGAAQIVLVGFPNAGKSSLLCNITKAHAKVADYAFTTVEPNVGMMPIKNVMLQLVDLPGLISGAAEGKGMGKRFLSVIRNSDIIAFVLDVNDAPFEKLDFLLREFDMAGIRLNKQAPDVKLYKKDSGGINILGKHLLEFPEIEAIESLRDFGILNADVRVNRRIGLEDFLDAIDKSVVWKKALAILTKIDLAAPEHVKKVQNELSLRGLKSVPISNTKKMNLQELAEELWTAADLMRIYTIEHPDSDPMVLPKGSSVMDMANRIHTDFAERFKYARVWGKSVRYDGQRVGRDHILMDGDIVELHTG